MAHDLNFNEQTGRYSFFSVQESAWHGLGQVISEHPTSEEAILHAGLDYEVIKSPIYTRVSGGIHVDASGTVQDKQDIIIPDQFATMRTDTNDVFGVVGKDYEVVQNRDAFNFFDAIVGGGDGIIYETAGALGKGERIFITAKLPDYIKVGNDDVVEKYLFLTTSHDGSGSITAAFTPVRIVCRNTLNAALGSMSNTIRIRHTANAKIRLEQEHRIMGMTKTLSIQLEGVFNQWAKVRITDKEVKRLIEMAMAPTKEILSNLKAGKTDELSTLYKNTCNEVFAYSMTSDTQMLDTTKGTVFGAYNAVTGYFQNVRNFKDEESKFKTIMYGTGMQRNQTAFDLCGNFAKNGVIAFN